ncbi:MAG: META domain-containing protein [Ignavibacteria bacterium]|nr:META domain-containing protein [Ignavibacteria bacterium]
MKNTLSLFLPALILLSCSASRETSYKITLESSQWIADSLDGKKVSLSGSSEITLEFDKPNGKVHGFAGCNRYSGNYSVNNENIKFSDISSTDAYCSDYDTETKFLRILLTSDRYSLTSAFLKIYSSGKLVIVLRKRK